MQGFFSHEKGIERKLGKYMRNMYPKLAIDLFSEFDMQFTLGYHFNEIDTVYRAKTYQADADGCTICYPLAHRG